jgi:flagellar biosynthesis regulator FlaF
MPKTAPQPAFGERTLAEIRAEGIGPEDITEDWMDDMVKRLFRELKRQLSQVENAKPAPETHQAGLRAANARTLAGLERTLERLARLEQQRALVRETKVTANKDNARAALERRITLLIETARVESGPERSE